jgi:2-iminobutanoate/2-iminopropanoate deaminase
MGSQQPLLQRIDPPGLARPGGHYSHACSVGELVFVSGQLGIRTDGSHTAQLPFAEQAEQALDNLLAVLAGCGLGPEDLAKVTVYVVGVEHWPEFDALYARKLGPVTPPRAVVPVPELHYGYRVEIEAIAVRGQGPAAASV